MPLPNTDENGTLKVCLQIKKYTTQILHLRLAHPYSKVFKQFIMCPKCVGVAPHSLDVGDAPASYSLAWKFSWALVHKLLHGLSMLLDLCFIFQAGIFYWMSLPLDHVFKVFFSPGPLANSFVQYAFHLWLLCNWHLFCPLNLWLFITCSYFLIFLWVQIWDIEYRRNSDPIG